MWKESFSQVLRALKVLQNASHLHATLHPFVCGVYFTRLRLCHHPRLVKYDNLVDVEDHSRPSDLSCEICP